MGTVHRAARRSGRRRAPLPAVLLLCLALPALTGCGAEAQRVESGRKEVHPEVEFLHDEAIRSALAEVPDGELTKIVLHHDEHGAPVWHTSVVTADGTEHRVRISATTGHLPVPPSPGGPVPERTEVLLEQAKLLPEEAARKVTKPDFGKVVEESLGVAKGRTVWFVEVATVEEDQVRRSAVDAVTGRVVESELLTGEAELHEGE